MPESENAICHHVLKTLFVAFDNFRQGVGDDEVLTAQDAAEVIQEAVDAAATDLRNGKGATQGGTHEPVRL